MLICRSDTGSDVGPSDAWALESTITESFFETYCGQRVMDYNTVEMDGGWFMAGTYVDDGYDGCWATPWDYVNVHGGLEGNPSRI